MSRNPESIRAGFVDETYPEHLHTWEIGTDGGTVKADWFFVGGKHYVPTWLIPEEALAIADQLKAAAELAIADRG